MDLRMCEFLLVWLETEGVFLPVSDVVWPRARAVAAQPLQRVLFRDG